MQTGENSGHGSDKSEAAHSPKANWTAAGSSNKLVGSMKSEDSQPVTVEDFSRRCLQGTKLRLGKVASKWGSRIRRKRRIVGGKKRDAVLEGSGPVKGREAHRRQRIRGAVNRFMARKPDGCRLPVGTSVLTRPAFLVLVVLCMAAAHAQQDKSAAPPHRNDSER